jgi:RimJ/RimL family protein N-acetyltransferase
MRLDTTRLEPRLVSDRLVLRPFLRADLDAIVGRANDYAVSSMLARVPFPYTLAEAEIFLTVARHGAEAGTDLTLVIEADRQPIGCMGLADIAGTAEFGYWLGRDRWGMGFATEAGRCFLAYAFAELPVDTVHSGVFADNAASLRVQEKLGFVRTGTVSRRFSLARGRDVDHIDTILTRGLFREATP